MKSTPITIGDLVKKTRKAMGMTQRDLAKLCGTGLRFIVDLEKGKETCQIGKVLTVVNKLGIQVKLGADLKEELVVENRQEAGPGASRAYDFDLSIMD